MRSVDMYQDIKETGQSSSHLLLARKTLAEVENIISIEHCALVCTKNYGRIEATFIIPRIKESDNSANRELLATADQFERLIVRALTH